ncbi:hypothetical protein ACQ7CU_01060 [Chryseobacterium arthrosphaerae]|uniref:hypothetical protein n=1 Tax=Chryseobacterium arthrosphaerae TaxID=651561 RepID=UPI003D3279A2
MKKILLSATMLVCFTAISKAQQGRVGINTTTPATTLDVVADAANTSKPDALLVPRLTRAQLTAKDAVYIAAQNGALAFVTTIDGTASTKTANVTAVGFYYYDSPSTTWKPLGGGASVDTSIYAGDGVLAGPRTVNQSNNNLTFTTGTGQFIVNGTSNLKGAQYTNIRVEPNANFSVQPGDYMIHYTGAGGTVTLPAAATEQGRELCFYAETATLNTGALGNGANAQPGYGTCIISNGTIWITKSAL